MQQIDDSYRFALRAARAALERHTGSNEESKQSLIEAVWWTAAADGYLREAYEDKWNTYKNQHKPADLLSGIYWARNRAIHDPLSLGTLTEESDSYPGTYSEGYGTLAWCPAAEVAKLDPSRDRGNGIESYAKALAGRPIVTTLTEAIRTLEGLDMAALE